MLKGECYFLMNFSSKKRRKKKSGRQIYTHHQSRCCSSAKWRGGVVARLRLQQQQQLLCWSHMGMLLMNWTHPLTHTLLLRFDRLRIKSRNWISKLVLMNVGCQLSGFFVFFSLILCHPLFLLLLVPKIGSTQVNSAVPNRFADCHRLKKGGPPTSEISSLRDKRKRYFLHCW